MNYTKNHHLPQWVSSDRVRMSDFNQMCRDLESGLDSNASAAASAQSAAASAQSTASTALAKAEAAYSPDNLPYVIGTYTGDGSSGQHIKIGFMPSFLAVTGMQASQDKDDTSPLDRYFAIVGGTGSIVNNQMQQLLQPVQNGFFVYKPGNGGYYLPILNEAGRKYYYLAFR